MFDLARSVAASALIQFAGQATIGLDPMAFLGTLSGFAQGDTIDSLATQASAAHFSGDTIVVTLSSGSIFSLDTASALTGSLTLSTAPGGDALLTYAASPAPHPALPKGW